MYTDLVNFRDVGGVRSRHGGTVRTGSVFRAGLFSFVGPEASDRVVNDLGIRTVIDMRTDHELAEHPRPPMYARHPDLRPVHLPFFHGPELAALSLPGGHDPEPWSIRYAAYTEVCGRFAAIGVFEELLVDDASPTVFHCWSGKDRTGLIAAMLLDLLGVDDEAIGADYQRSMTWWLPRVAHNELAEGEPPAGYRTVSDVIVFALRKLRQRFGTLEEMLLQSGMQSDLPDRMRAALLE